MLITTDIFGNLRDKVQIAIDRLRMFEPEDGYYVGFSGGKDSQAVYHLCKRAGVKFDAHYSITTVDPPKLVRFIKTHYPDVSMDFPRDRDGNVITMWNLIPQKKMPPTCTVRYCCEKLKESAGKGRITVTGVRWSESVKRAKNQGILRVDGKRGKMIANAEDVEFGINKRNALILNYDDDKACRIAEQCYRTSKTLLNPIVDWEEEDVWEYLNEVEQVEHCELYDQGFKRLGCIGCPMSRNAADELERWAAYKRNYIKAFERMLVEREKAGLVTEWRTGEEVMDWWLRKKTVRKDDAQVCLDDLKEVTT